SVQEHDSTSFELNTPARMVLHSIKALTLAATISLNLMVARCVTRPSHKMSNEADEPTQSELRQMTTHSAS
ncbi:unnamed protein product, partial [Mycena citricolor]